MERIKTKSKKNESSNVKTILMNYNMKDHLPRKKGWIIKSTVHTGGEKTTARAGRSSQTKGIDKDAVDNGAETSGRRSKNPSP